MKILFFALILFSTQNIFAAAGDLRARELLGILSGGNGNVAVDHCAHGTGPKNVQAVLNSWLLRPDAETPGFIFASAQPLKAEYLQCLYLAARPLAVTVGTVDEPSTEHPTRVLEALCFEVDAGGAMRPGSILHQCY